MGLQSSKMCFGYFDETPMGLRWDCRWDCDGTADGTAMGLPMGLRWDCRWDCDGTADGTAMGLRWDSRWDCRWDCRRDCRWDCDGAPMKTPMGLPMGLPISAVPPPSGVFKVRGVGWADRETALYLGLIIIANRLPTTPGSGTPGTRRNDNSSSFS